MTQQELHEVAEGIRSPEQVSMTLAEFLEHDIDGYEYVKGELVPMSPPKATSRCLRAKTCSPTRMSYRDLPVPSRNSLSNCSLPT